MSEPNEAIEVTAPSVDEAIEQALAKLGASQDDVVIQVLSTPRSGVLGLGARQARVRVERRALEAASSGVMSPPPAPPLPPRSLQPATRTTVSGLGAQSAPQGSGTERSLSEIPSPAGYERSPQTPSPLAPAAPPEDRPQRRAETAAPSEEGAAGDDVGEAGRQTAGLDDQEREATSILARILEFMGERSEITTTEKDSEGIELAIKGDGSGLLIGRHGQTLDALEYLVNRILARRVKDALPITVDTESYRERRRRQLHRMALSMAEQTKREHTQMALEPMPPRDRRIVHLALKDDPLITTRSTGDGFLRVIEIIPVGERREGDGGRKQHERGGSAGGSGRPRQRERQREPESQREHGDQPVGQQGGFKHGQKRIF